MSEAKKLEWRMSSDGDRCYANVTEGQLIITESWKGWIVEWMYIAKPLMESLKVRFEQKAYWFLDEAKTEVEHWYESQGKENNGCSQQSET